MIFLEGFPVSTVVMIDFTIVVFKFRPNLNMYTTYRADVSVSLQLTIFRAGNLLAGILIQD